MMVTTARMQVEHAIAFSHITVPLVHIDTDQIAQQFLIQQLDLRCFQNIQLTKHHLLSQYSPNAVSLFGFKHAVAKPAALLETQQLSIRIEAIRVYGHDFSLFVAAYNAGVQHDEAAQIAYLKIAVNYFARVGCKRVFIAGEAFA
mgnify:CR=1 FL=1